MNLKIVVAAALLSLFSAEAHSETVKFDIVYGTFNPGVIESFDVDLSQIGTPSVGEASGSDYGDFAITHDTLGYTLLQVSTAALSNYFATADNDNDATFSGLFPYTYLTTQIYDSGTQMISAHVGETFQSQDGSVLTVAAVPEPGTWALLLVGIAGLGATFRARSRAAIPAA